MALLRLIAEGVGPFKRLDLDFSDGKEHPRLGPHILAGVNGSGKSTVLRAIAWAFSINDSGFDLDSWRHLTAGHGTSRVFAIFAANGRMAEQYAFARGFETQGREHLRAWAQTEADLSGIGSQHFAAHATDDTDEIGFELSNSPGRF